MLHRPEDGGRLKRRRPYSPPAVVAADELRFETRLQCAGVKTSCAPPLETCNIAVTS